MASQIQVANRALSKIGEQRITSLAQDTQAARAVNAAWDILRDAELRARAWNFAIARDSLAALVAAPEFGYAYQYQVPSDFLRLIQVSEYYPSISLSDYRGSSEAMWQLEGNVILTDLPSPLYIRYVKRVETVGNWDPLFCEAFACRLAAELCEGLTQSGGKRELAWAEYRRALAEAVRADAIENPPEYLPDDAWLISRM